MGQHPFTAEQLKIMKALRDNDRSMWQLAGHWYFDRPQKALSKLKVQSIDEMAMALLSAIDPLTLAEPGKLTTYAQNKAAVLCSYILWEALFPGERGPKGLIEAMRSMLVLAEQPAALLTAIDIFTRMPDGVGYGIMFDFRCSDPVRMVHANQEGAIEYFEQALEEPSMPGPTP